MSCKEQIVYVKGTFDSQIALHQEKKNNLHHKFYLKSYLKLF